MHAEEQAEEVEALQAIYPDEFELVSSDPSCKYKLKLRPNDATGECHVIVNLFCDIPSDYPEVQPGLRIESVKGLGPKLIEDLTEVAKSTAADNVGMPSIFVIAEAIKEWLGDNNVAGQDGSMYSDMMRRMQQKDTDQKKKATKAAVAAAADKEGIEEAVDPEELERIRKRQAGTAVTMESFLAWREAFEAEQKEKALAAASAKGKPIVDVDSDRPTGKQLFMSNRAGMEEALLLAAEEADAAGGAEGEEEVVIDDDIFLHEDDLDDSDFVPDEEEGEDDDDDEDEDGAAVLEDDDS